MDGRAQFGENCVTSRIITEESRATSIQKDGDVEEDLWDSGVGKEEEVSRLSEENQ